jgi:hypothetical protein
VEGDRRGWQGADGHSLECTQGEGRGVCEEILSGLIGRPAARRTDARLSSVFTKTRAARRRRGMVSP